MSKKETVGSDPFAEFGGAAISEDPFAEFGGEAEVQEQPAAPLVEAVLGKPLAPPSASATDSPSTSGVGTSQLTSDESGRTFDEFGDAVATPATLPDLSERPKVIKASGMSFTKLPTDPIKKKEASIKTLKDKFGIEPSEGEDPTDLLKRMSSYYDERFSALDMAGVSKVKKGVQESMGVINKLGEELSQESALLDQSLADLEKMRADIGQRVYSDQSSLDQDASDYDAAVKNHNAMVDGIMSRSRNLQSMSNAMERDARMAALREYDIRKETGSTGGAATLAIPTGIGTMTSGLVSYIIDGMTTLLPKEFIGPEVASGEMTRDQAAKEVKRMMLDPIRKGAPQMTRKALDLETTEEYYDNMKANSFMAQSLLGAAESVPAMVTPFFAGAFFQSSDAVGKELESEEYDDIPEAEKVALRTAVGAVGMFLERYGFRNMIGNNAVTKRILASAAAKIPANATPGMIQRVLDAETRSWVTNFGVRMVGGAVSELETGSAQTAAELAIKEAYNQGKGRKVFSTPETWAEAAYQIAEAGLSEMVGAGAMNIPSAIGQARRTGSMTKAMTDRQYEMFEGLLKDPDYAPTVESYQADMVAAGKMTEAESQKRTEDLRVAKSIAEQIPDDIPVEKRRQAFDLLMERESLKGKEKSLVADKIASIQERLAALVPQVQEEAGDASPTSAATEVVAEPEPEAKPATSLVPENPTVSDLDGLRVTYNKEEGYVYQDGQVIVVETDGGRIYEIGNAEQLGSSLAADLGIEVSDTRGDFVFQEDGSVKVGRNNYVNNNEDPVDAVVVDQNGNVVSVSLAKSGTNAKGTAQPGQYGTGLRVFRGQQAEDMAYEIMLQQMERVPDSEGPRLTQIIQQEQKSYEADKRAKAPAGKPSKAKQDKGAAPVPEGTQRAAQKVESKPAQNERNAKSVPALPGGNERDIPSSEGAVSNDVSPKGRAVRGNEAVDGAQEPRPPEPAVGRDQALRPEQNEAPVAVRESPKDKGEATALQDEAGPKGDGVTAPYIVPAAKEYGEFHVTYDPETKKATAIHRGKLKNTWSRIKDSKKAKKEFNRASRALTQAKLAAVNKFVADTGVEVVKGKNAAQQRKDESIERKQKEASIFKRFDWFDDETKGAYGMALSSFASKGVVSAASMRKYLGWGAGKNTGDAVKSKRDQARDISAEEKSASWALSDTAPSIASLAHKMYEGAPKDENGDALDGFGTADFEQAIAAVVSGFKSREDALQALDDYVASLEDSVKDPDKMLEEYQAAQLRAMQEAGINIDGLSVEEIQSAITEAEDEDVNSDLFFGPPKTTTDEERRTSESARMDSRQESGGNPEGATGEEGTSIEGADDLTADDIFGWAESDDPMFQLDQRRKELENELAAARRAVTLAEKDINERGQSLFGDALDANGQTIVGDAFDNSPENYNRIMAPLRARVDKAKSDLEAYDRNKAASDAAQGSLFQREGNKGGKVYATRVAKALSKIAPGITIESFTSREEYAAAIKARGEQEQFASSVAVYFPATNEILLSPAADGQSLMHEAAHPILIAALKNNPDLLANFYEQIAADPALAKYITFGEGYADQGNVVVMAEAIVEFMADVAAGNIKVSTDPQSAWQKFKAWVKDLLAKLGIELRDIDMSKPTDVRTFAAAFSKAVNKGIPMMGLPTVGGAGAPSLQQDQAFNGTETPKTPIGDTKTVMVDGKERTVFNSNGKPIHPTVEGVRNFWRWFGESKVVDEQGRPKVVYRGQHGASGNIETFLGSYSFGTSEIASEYAERPNDNRMVASAPTVYPAYLRLLNPIIHDASDPYIDLSDVFEMLGEDVAKRAALDFQDEIMNTNFWEEEYPEYESVDALLKENPSALKTLYVLAFNLFDAKWFVDAAQANGFDGAVHGEYGYHSEVDNVEDAAEVKVFDLTQIKSATGNYGTFSPSSPSILEQRPPGSMIPKQQYNAAIRATGASFAIDKDLNKAINAGLKALRDKTPGSWWTSLSPEDQKKAEGEFRGVIKGKIASKVNPTKATVNVMSALKDQIRLRARAAREAKADVSQRRKEFAAQVKDMISNELRGRIAPVQANALVTAAAITNPDSPRAVDRFVAYADRVIKDANYAEDVNAAKKVRNEARKLKRTPYLPANLKHVLKSLSNINPRLLEKPAEFAARGNEFLRTFKKPGSNKYNMGSSDAMMDYLMGIESQILAAKEAADQAALKADMEGVAADYMAMFAMLTGKDKDGKTVDDYLAEAGEERAEAIRKHMVGIAERARQDLSQMDTSEMSKEERKEYDSLLSVDLNLMGVKELASFTFGVDNLVVNESFDGIASVSVYADAVTGAQKLATMTANSVLRSDWPTGSTKHAKNAWRQMFYGAPNVLARIYGYTKNLGVASSLLGLQDIDTGRTSADNSVSSEDQKLSNVIRAKVIEGRSKGRKVHSARNRAAEGVVAFAIQQVPGYSEERSLKARKNIIEQDIQRNSKEDPGMYAHISEMYDTLVKDADSAEDIMENLKRLMPENYDIIQHLIGMNESYRDELLSHNRRLRNQDDAPAKWYLTTRYQAAESATEDKKDKLEKGKGYKSPFDQFIGTLANPTQAGSLKSRGAYENLRSGAKINYNIRRTSMDALRENLYDARTSRSWLYAHTILRSPNISDIMGGPMNVKFVDRMMRETHESHTSNYVEDKNGGRYADWLAQKIKNMGSFWGLAGFLQLIQQPADQLSNALVNSMMRDGSKSFGKAGADVFAAVVLGKDNGLKSLLSLASIGERSALLSGTRWSAEMKSAQSSLERAMQSGSLRLIQEAHDKLGRTWFAALSGSDVASATTAWLDSYMHYIKSEGKELGSWHDEAAKVMSGDDVRRAALAYAEMMTSVTQGPSDPAMFPGWSRRSKNGWLNLAKAAVNPFGGFQSTVLGRMSGSMSEIMTYWNSPVSDTEAKERFDAAARILASTAISQAVYQGSKIYLATKLIEGGSYLVGKFMESLFEDDEDEDITLMRMAFVMEVLFTVRVVDRDINRIFQQASRDAQSRQKLGPLYDPDRIKQEKARDNLKMGMTQYLMSMTVSGIASHVDQAAVDAMNWSYWAAMTALDDPEFKKRDGTNIPYDQWKKDMAKTPFARSGQWSEAPSYGLIDIVMSRPKRLLDAGSKAFTGISDEDKAKAVKYEYRDRWRTFSTDMNTLVWKNRQAKTRAERAEVDRAAKALVDTQPIERRSKLLNAYREAIITPEVPPLYHLIKAESSPEVRAAMFFNIYSDKSKEEQQKMWSDAQKAGVVNDAFLEHFAKFSKTK